MPHTIGIIGGRGRMGSALAEFFKEKGHTVLISDKGTRLSNRALAKKADVVIVSVPIGKTVKTIEAITDHVRPSALLMDLTSIKEAPIQAMIKSRSAVIGLHPMCNETTFGPGQTLLYSPVRPGKWSSWFREVFKEFKCIKISPRKHDHQMALAQALIHFVSISLGRTLYEINPKLKHVLELASPASQLKLKITARHLAQSAELYGGIQIHNKQNRQILNAYRKAVGELVAVVERGNLDEFKTYYKKGARFFGKFGELYTRFKK